MSKRRSSDSEEIAEGLHSVAIRLLRRVRKQDESSGLNAPRLSALSVIVLGGPITLRDLAAAEQVRPPTMTRIVNALVEQGLVMRKPNAEDGRSVLLSATVAGKRLLVAGRRRRVRSLAGEIERLSERERGVVAEAVGILGGMVCQGRD
jgi:DNA-binding MarR family transcriptional regulator